MSGEPPQAYEDATGEDAVGITGAVRAVFTAPILAVASGLAGLVAVAFESIGEVVRSLSAVRDFIVAFIADGPITIIETGAEVTSGELAEFGVAAFVVAAIVIAGAWVAWSTVDPDIPLLDSLLPWR